MRKGSLPDGAEETSHIGGKILTTRILEDGRPVPDGARVEKDAKLVFIYEECVKDKKITRPIEFFAEFGPIRIELGLQENLNALLESLGLDKETERFPPYQSPPSERDPKYKLTDEESAQSTPLDLLKLAV